MKFLFSIKASGVCLETIEVVFRIDLMRCRQVKLHVAKRCHTVTWTISLVVNDFFLCYRFALPSDVQMIGICRKNHGCDM